jgi:AraC-like DNA-binding protein
METAKLIDLIETLSCGTKLHIGVLFFGNYGNEKLILPHAHQIHFSPLCEQFKSTGKGYRRCFRCRNASIRKALSGKTSFGGCCLNGVYEYTRPIVENGVTMGMIYIGNLLPKDDSLLRARVGEYAIDESLIHTLEQGVMEQDCERMADVIESYIRMLVALYPHKEQTNPLVENLKNYVLANLEYPLVMNQISKAFHYNSKYLGRVFKSEIGMSLCQYVNRKRIELAKEYLSKGGESIIQIAYKIGFENVTYFNRVFKSIEGVTPTEYRKKMRGE